jgi:hypothetical protein
MGGGACTGGKVEKRVVGVEDDQEHVSTRNEALERSIVVNNMFERSKTACKGSGAGVGLKNVCRVLETCRSGWGCPERLKTSADGIE